MNIAIVYNRSKNRHVLQQLLQYLSRQSIQVNLIATDNLEDGIAKMASLSANQVDVVIVAGGDGTVLSVINGMIKMQQKDLPILILPLGTANDFARELNIYSLKDAMEALNEFKMKKVDLIKCIYFDKEGNKKILYANSSAGIGFLSDIFSRQQTLVFRLMKSICGSFAYAIASFLRLAIASGYKANIKIDNQAIKEQIQMLVIRKTKMTGPVSLVPFAKPDSGQLNAALFGHTNVFNRFKIAMMMLMKNKPIENEAVQYFGDTSSLDNAIASSSKITIESEEQMPFDLNGEFIGYAPCDFELESAQLNVLYRVGK